ncbi:ABC transporter ATP-binding protein [Marinivivus vitaminiproducens]|uniref:ABC transporter ATP-binding protein n=1 Tax=Marinivivus vitaminiproducens TaxID=3035935 RepID=UPI0027A813FA|nr:ABC transporter ATP-binding protein [Geminicoccaceae bacterium SCSIO 64248]
MLALEGLERTYADSRGNAVGLGRLDLDVAEHETLAVVGTSGCGKSTLLRMIAGLETPSAGTVRLNGERVVGPRDEIGVVFQEPRLMPWLSVRANVRLALLGRPKAEQSERVDAVLAMVGLERFADALPKALSGGMAQRVAIARALVRRPDILLLDEPFSALDSFTRMRLQEHLVELWRGERFTMILVTHDIEEALVLADRVVVLGGQPGSVRATVRVDLDKPRERTYGDFQALKRRILGELDPSRKPQYEEVSP